MVHYLPWRSQQLCCWHWPKIGQKRTKEEEKDMSNNDEWAVLCAALLIRSEANGTTPFSYYDCIKYRSILIELYFSCHCSGFQCCQISNRKTRFGALCQGSPANPWPCISATTTWTVSLMPWWSSATPAAGRRETSDLAPHSPEWNSSSDAF